MAGALFAAAILVLGALLIGVARAPEAVPAQPADAPFVHMHPDGHWWRHDPLTGLATDFGRRSSPSVAPLADPVFSFGAAGDFGFSGDAQAVMEAMGSAGLDFAIVLGDTTYGDTSEENWCNVFESKVGQGRVLLIAGNHDSGESGGGNINTLRDHCDPGVARNLTGDYGKEYYFDYPESDPLARFILTACGVSMRVDGQGRWDCNAGDAHYDFVSNAIDGARDAGIPYVIVGMHKNCITNGVKDCTIGEAFQDLLLSKKVDLVLQAHDHNYQRSHQLTCADDNNFRPECVADTDDDYQHGEGEALNIVGTGGQGTYPTGGTADEPYFNHWSSSTKGFLKVDVSSAGLAMNFTNVVGSYTDSYLINAGPAVPDFSISANPRSATFVAGRSASTTVTVTMRNGFNGTVNLTTGSSPVGVTTTCVPSNVTGNGTARCTMTGATPGAYRVTVTGTSGSLVHTTAVAVTVSAPVPPDFSISADPRTVAFLSGGSGATTATVQATGEFNGTVELTAASAPSGVTTTCVPSRVTGGSGSSSCSMTASATGSYTVTLTGRNGSLVHSTAVSVKVSPPGPTARFTFDPPFPGVGQDIAFNASSSTDTDPRATLECRWDWDGDGVWDTPYSTALTARYAYDAAGTYPVGLEIRDSNGLVDAVTYVVSVGELEGADMGAPPGYGLTDPTRLQARGPIYIGSNTAFTAANGVRGGTGTAGDPYVIADWSIDASLYPWAQAMIHIENTDAYVIVENNKIVNLTGSNHWEAIQVGGNWPATIPTAHVTIRHNLILNARHAYGIAVRSGSSNVYVGANHLELDANFEDVYGIATDRNVHDVTILGNYVDAYTSGTFRTAGVHVGVTYVGDPRRATDVVVQRNTVVNATAGGIISLNSDGTRIEANLVYTDYPGPKSVGPDYPRGIVTEHNSVGTLVARNRIQGVHWGIEVGADRGTFASNTISNVDYAMYVVDNGTFPGATSFGETIYNTTYFGAEGGIRLPADFHGTVVDLGAEIRPANTSAETLAIAGTGTQISYVWSGQLVNLSVAVEGNVLFDTALSSESQSLSATWTGSIADFEVTRFEIGRVAFQLQASGPVTFSGSGFVPGETYTLNRTIDGGATTVLIASSSPTGTLTFTIPDAAVPATFLLQVGGTGDPFTPLSAPNLEGTEGTNGWYVSQVSVTLTAWSPSGAPLSINYRVDDEESWTTYTSPFPVGEGDHTVHWQVSDDAGHRGPIESMPVQVDLTAPVVTSLSPSGSVADLQATISWTGFDGVSGIARYEVRADGEAFQSVGTTTSLQRSWSAGSHTVEVKAIDNAGHETVATTQFTVEAGIFGSGGLLQVLPISFPIVALALLGASFALLRLRRQTEISKGGRPATKAPPPSPSAADRRATESSGPGPPPSPEVEPAERVPAPVSQDTSSGPVPAPVPEDPGAESDDLNPEEIASDAPVETERETEFPESVPPPSPEAKSPKPIPPVSDPGAETDDLSPEEMASDGERDR